MFYRDRNMKHSEVLTSPKVMYHSRGPIYASIIVLALNGNGVFSSLPLYCLASQPYITIASNTVKNFSNIE
jgi:hypothetical protein